MGHREELLTAARKLLREKGFARTTARDLVAASNTNLASIGYHFGSKERLLHLAMEAEFAEWVEHVGRIALAGDDATPLGRLVRAWATARDTFPRHRPLLVAYVEAAAQAERSTEVRAQLAGHLAAARGRIAGLVAQTMPVEPAQALAVASFLVAVCDGLALQWLFDPDGVPGGDELSAALALTAAAPAAPAARRAPPDPASAAS